MKTFDIIAAVLLVVGGLNWGLVGAFGFDLVATIFGQMSGLSKIVYVLVGLAAIYQGLSWKAINRRWATAH
jgi:uncharacterized membrane protein YuzA (DUF378 family)